MTPLYAQHKKQKGAGDVYIFGALLSLFALETSATLAHRTLALELTLDPALLPDALAT